MRDKFRLRHKSVETGSIRCDDKRQRGIKLCRKRQSFQTRHWSLPLGHVHNSWTMICLIRGTRGLPLLRILLKRSYFIYHYVYFSSCMWLICIPLAHVMGFLMPPPKCFHCFMFNRDFEPLFFIFAPGQIFRALTQTSLLFRYRHCCISYLFL